MPIYEYQCVECKAQLELRQPMDQDPERCPRCGAARSLMRQLSHNNFALKGSGWYKTDYSAK